jgi:hypothetical protein
MALGLSGVVFVSLGLIFLFDFRGIATRSHQAYVDFWTSVPYIGSGVVLRFAFYRYFQALILIVPSLVLFVILAFRIL